MCLLLYAQGYFSDVLTGREVSFMSMDMAEEIRAQEAAAHEMVAAAKADAVRSLAEARTSAEQSVKEAKQKFHRLFREQILKAEAEAEAEATTILERGKRDAEEYYQEKSPLVDEVSKWLAKEVMTTYGAG